MKPDERSIERKDEFFAGAIESVNVSVATHGRDDFVLDKKRRDVSLFIQPSNGIAFSTETTEDLFRFVTAMENRMI